MPRSPIDLIVATIAGSLGSISSTSIAADARLRGPSRVYLLPYSAVVTCAFDLRTE